MTSMVMSIDVEDWFQVENLKPVIAREQWDQLESRVESNTHRMLDRLAEHDRQATFFVLGYVAKRHPGLVRRIVADGHELASHGHEHELVYRQTPHAFRQDVQQSKHLLEDLGGVAVQGYRAPSFSITDWALPILRDVGYRYDSSSFPVKHPRYGQLSGVAGPICEVLPGLWEVCISSLQLGGANLPWGGGGYFRLLPPVIFNLGMQQVFAQTGSYVFYLHPWELDPAQPRVSGLSAISCFRHRVNLRKTDARWTTLLRDHTWQTAAARVAHAAAEPDPTRQAA